MYNNLHVLWFLIYILIRCKENTPPCVWMLSSILYKKIKNKNLMLTTLTYRSSNVPSWKAEATRLTYRSHLGLLVCALCVRACGKSNCLPKITKISTTFYVTLQLCNSHKMFLFQGFIHTQCGIYIEYKHSLMSWCGSIL